MPPNRTKTETWARLIGVFIGVVVLTVVAFFVFSILMNPAGDEGALVIMSFIISIQLSFLIAYVITHSKK